MSLAHILERFSVGICLLCVGLVLELPEDTLVMLSFHFLFCEETYTCLSIVGLIVVQQVATLESCDTFLFFRTSPSLITSHFMLFYFSSSSSSCTCSSFSNVLSLYAEIFTRSPLVWWFFLAQRFLAPPVCSIGGPEPPPRSHTSMLLVTGCLGLFVLCMLVFMAYPSTLANAGWKEVPKLEYQA